MQTKRLNDGVEIPVYGFGTFQIPADGSTYKAVRKALELGKLWKMQKQREKSVPLASAI